MKRLTYLFLTIGLLSFMACNSPESSTPEQEPTSAEKPIPEPQYSLTKDQTHNKFSNTIPPILTVPSGAVIEAYTEDASDEQFHIHSNEESLDSLSFDPIHPLTGPVYVEGAQPGDMLKVTLHKV